MSAQSLLDRVVAGASMPPLGGRILLRPAPAPRREAPAGRRRRDLGRVGIRPSPSKCPASLASTKLMSAGGG